MINVFIFKKALTEEEIEGLYVYLVAGESIIKSLDEAKEKVEKDIKNKVEKLGGKIYKGEEINEK